MNIEVIFKKLKSNGRITKEELKAYGANDMYINEAVKEGILIDKKDYYISGNTCDLLEYGRVILEEGKNYKAANSVFDCAYFHDPFDFNINFQLLYRTLVSKKPDGNFLKYFDVVYRKMKESGNLYDANYYLYLLGSLYKLDDKYNKIFMDISEQDILIPDEDDYYNDENELRKVLFKNSYFDVDLMVDRIYTNLSNDEKSIGDMLERELLLKWLVSRRIYKQKLVASFDENNFEKIKCLMDNEDEKRNLSINDQYILKIVNCYFMIKTTGIVPQITGISDDAFEAINANNFRRALELEENYYGRFHKERAKLLVNALKEIVNLIDLIEAGNYKIEVTNEDVLTDEEKKKIDYKVEQIFKGRSIYLLEPMNQKKRDLVRDYLSEKYKDKNISAFSIGIEPERRCCLRYKEKVNPKIDIFGIADEARALYKAGVYSEAKNKYKLLLKIGKPRDITYGLYGLTLMKLREFDEAIDSLKVATIISYEKGGDLDYSELIERLENRVTVEDSKTKPTVSENEFTNGSDVLLTDELINDLIGLTNEGELSLETACVKLCLSLEDINYVKLVYARDYYYLGLTEYGDSYLKQVEKSKNKDKRVKDLFKEIQLNKKYYAKRYVENSNQLVFVKR